MSRRSTGRRRRIQTDLRPPVGRTRAQIYPKIRVYLQSRPRADLRRRKIHSHLSPPVGRTATRVYPHVRVYLWDRKRADLRRRSTHSKLSKPHGAFITIYPRRILVRLIRRRRPIIHSRLRSPVRPAPVGKRWPIRVQLQHQKFPKFRYRIKSRLRGVFGGKGGSAPVVLFTDSDGVKRRNRNRTVWAALLGAGAISNEEFIALSNSEKN